MKTNAIDISPPAICDVDYTWPIKAQNINFQKETVWLFLKMLRDFKLINYSYVKC